MRALIARGEHRRRRRARNDDRRTPERTIDGDMESRRRFLVVVVSTMTATVIDCRARTETRPVIRGAFPVTA